MSLAFVRRISVTLALVACSVAPVLADQPYGAQPLTPPLSNALPGTNVAPTVTDPGTTTGTAPETYDPSTSYAAQSATYSLRPGDLISINVFGQPAFSENAARLLPDGSVGLPLVGTVKVSGMTPARAATAINDALKRYLRSPQTTVSVLQVAPVAVLVLGNVRTPNRYLLGPQSRLLDALTAAGGLAPINGDLPDAHIETGTADVTTVSLEKLLVHGDFSQNRPLENGMTIYIPSPIVFQVQVFGAVDHSGDVTVAEGDRLSMAVARAGVSASSNSDLNHVFFKRTNSDGSVTSQTVDLYKVLSDKDVAADPVLRKNDLISIPKSRGAQTNGFLSVIYSLAGFARL